MPSLNSKQHRFMRLVPRLIDKAHELGFEVTMGDGYRDARVFGPMGTRMGYGESNSCHKLRLAIDLNLFKNGKYLTTTDAHIDLGAWWEAQDEDARWGGRFDDGNHYSFTHDGNM